MPPQTNVYDAASQARSAPVLGKGLLGFFKSKAEPVRDWTTVRTLGHTPTRRAARRPVWE